MSSDATALVVVASFASVGEGTDVCHDYVVSEGGFVQQAFAVIYSTDASGDSVNQ